MQEKPSKTTDSSPKQLPVTTTAVTAAAAASRPQPQPHAQPAQPRPLFTGYSGRGPIPPSKFNESGVPALPPQRFSYPPVPVQSRPPKDSKDGKPPQMNRGAKSGAVPGPVGYPGPPPRPRGTGYEYYPGPPPPGFVGSPHRDPYARNQRPDGGPPAASPDRPYPQPGDHFPPPYAMYPGGRPQGWPPGAEPPRYGPPHPTPYTNAQRIGAGAVKGPSPGGPGDPSMPPGMPPHYRLVGPPPPKKSLFHHRVGHRVGHRPDADARAYKAVEGRDGATSPSQIDANRRDDVSNMGCTCKKSKCLKLYCVCFGASVMCGTNCRCLVCHNVGAHEQVRKDAIRSILARNPSAFDTKFRKLGGLPGVQIDAISRTNATGKALTHKLGCKCRKSFCTKKYCECYNAGVKCSGSCRCVGCKNLPPGGFGATGAAGSAPEGSPIEPRRGPQKLSMNGQTSKIAIPGRGVAEIPKSILAGIPLRIPEHKMMDAAQNLAFLKHQSPARKVVGSREGAPGLAATTSSGASSSSPDGGETNRKEAGVNPLLLAAVAMTQLGTKPGTAYTPNGKLRGRSGSNDDDQFADAMTPGRSPAVKRKSGANAAAAAIGELFVGAQAYRRPAAAVAPSPAAPKVKLAAVNQFDDADDGKELPSKNRPPVLTPSDIRQAKRSRIQTMEENKSDGKKLEFDRSPRPEALDKGKDESDDSPSSDKSNHAEDNSPVDFLRTLAEKATDVLMNTPKTARLSTKILTPVSARCIDFQHMGVDGKAGDGDEEMADEKKQADSVIAS